MARPGGPETRATIRAATRELIAERGLDAFTLDAVAERVGLTRQAVLYHFGSREGVLSEAVLDVLEAESVAIGGAAEHAPDGLPGVAPFLHEALAWYLADPNRFRLVYAVNQVSPVISTVDEATLRERVYPITGRMYAALEQRLAAGPLPDGVDPRKLGVALHMFTLGVACYEAMLDAIDQRFAHDWHDVADALAGALAKAPGEAAPTDTTEAAR